MPRLLQLAAVQLEAAPAPLSQRLQRAADQISAAAQTGAQLIVLPESFNTGYSYNEALYSQAETMQGPTLTWLKAQAAENQVYVAGSFMLRETDEVYQAAFLVAPDGQLWRYDKQYPYLWERSFYREGRGLCIAETSLGRIGLMIGWDAGHAELWERYAGRVDLMLILSTAPDLPSASLQTQSGESISVRELSPLHDWASRSFANYLGADLQNQARWMGVPVVVSSAWGQFSSSLPMPMLSLGTLLANRSDLWGWLKQAGNITLNADFAQFTQIVAADGAVIALASEQKDCFIQAEISLPEFLPQPTSEAVPLQVPSLAYPLIDGLGVAAMAPVYRRGLRRQWGARMAPPDSQTRLWQRLLVGVLLLGVWLGSRRR